LLKFLYRPVRGDEATRLVKSVSRLALDRCRAAGSRDCGVERSKVNTLQNVSWPGSRKGTPKGRTLPRTAYRLVCAFSGGRCPKGWYMGRPLAEFVRDEFGGREDQSHADVTRGLRLAMVFSRSATKPALRILVVGGRLERGRDASLQPAGRPALLGAGAARRRRASTTFSFRGSTGLSPFPIEFFTRFAGAFPCAAG